LRANISPPSAASLAGLATYVRQAVVEVADRHFQGLGQLPQPCGRDAVGAALVFLNLLEAYADRAGQLLLGQTQQTTAATQALAQMSVDVVAHGSLAP
jgi:Zn-dependent protease with chaperone function